MHFNYVRHVVLLSGMTGMIIAAPVRGIAAGGVAAFALYGALHATSLALSLRAARSLRRRLLFIAAAAVLCLSIACLGVRAVPLTAALHGYSGPMAILSVCSIAGAFAYGLLVRAFWIPELDAAALASTALACGLATGAAFYAGIQYQRFGGASLAVAWWCAFSGGLWYHDCRRIRHGPGCKS